MRKTIEQIKESAEYKAVMDMVHSYHFVNDRTKALKSAGYEPYIFPMGSGGVGQIKKARNNSFRVQISYGTGRYNYAWCVTIKSNEQ